MLSDFKAFQLAKILYQQCKVLKIPSSLKDQLMRASSSVALNLAESSGMRTERERLRLYTIAFGSLRECEAILELENITDSVIKDVVRQLGAILFRLNQIESKPTNQTLD